MRINVQSEKDLIIEDVIGTLVSDEGSDDVIGEVISYDPITGLTICELYDVD